MRVVIYQIEKHEKIIYNLGMLLDKLCISGKKIGILCSNDTMVDVDKNLWTFSTNAFIPHNIASTDIDDNNNNLQPVLLTQNGLDIIDRDIICVLDVKNMQNISDILNATGKDKQEIFEDKDIICVTYDNIVDQIKYLFPMAQIDVYKKTNGRWQKGQFWFDNKTGKVLYY